MVSTPATVPAVSPIIAFAPVVPTSAQEEINNTLAALWNTFGLMDLLKESWSSPRINGPYVENLWFKASPFEVQFGIMGDAWELARRAKCHGLHPPNQASA